MARRRPSFTPDPRIWNEFQVATRLGHSESWLHSHRAELETQGFPTKDEVLGGTDADAISVWLDKRSSLADGREEQLPDTGLAERLEALRDGKAGSAVPPRQA